MKKFELNDKQKVLIILVVIMIVQVGVRFYVGLKKNYFHMDEMYSYGLMNYDKGSIVDNEDFLDTWHDKNYYLDYLEVNSNEKWDLKAVYENQKNDVHPPFYYLLLRITSTFSIDHFTKWSGLFLNMFIFIISNILVYKTSKLLFRNSFMSLLCVTINGFSIIAIDSFLYIRMYELSNMFVLAITYLHIKLWRTHNVTYKNLLPIMIIFILGGLTHYYFFVYGFILYLLYSIKCIKNKHFKNLIRYQVAIIISAVIYLVIFPYSIEHLLFKNSSFSGTEDYSIFVRLGNYLSLIHNKFLHNLLLPFVIIILFITYKKHNKHLRFNSQIYLLLFPIIIYLLVVIKFSPYIETRYVIPIYSVSFLLIFYIIKKYLFEHIANNEVVFLLILLVTTFAYSPISTHYQFEFAYEQYSDITKQVEEKKLPIVYYFNTNNNRFLDDLYLFTLADKSIVLNANNGLEKLINISNEEKNFILICNEGVNEDELKSTISGYYFYLQRMNSCNVYEFVLKEK